MNNELSFWRKAGLLAAVVAIVAIAFLITFRTYDNIDDDFSYDLNEDGSVTVTGHSGENRKLTIPEEIDGHTVSAIGKSAFENKANLRELTVPGCVTVIGEYAFDNCRSLRTVKLGEGLTGIGHYAFYGCVNLKSADLPSTLTSIGDFAFYGCRSLTKLVMPASCAFIGTDALASCPSLMLDCSENEYAATVAAAYSIPTDVRNSNSYIKWMTVSITAVLTAAAVTLVILLPRFIAKKRNKTKNA